MHPFEKLKQREKIFVNCPEAAMAVDDDDDDDEVQQQQQQQERQ